MGVCALVGKVEFNAGHFLQQSFDCVVAVDGGLSHLQTIDVVPDAVIGDFDSLGFVPDHPLVERFPEHKDESDIELAMLWAQGQGFDTLVVYGCLGGRLDFTYAVCQLLAKFAQKGLKVFALDNASAITALVGGSNDTLRFSPQASGTISVFSASGKATGVIEAGLTYPLSGATLSDTEPLGVSNEFTGSPAEVSVGEGTLLVFFPVAAWNTIIAD
ncbi:MAG: thiamine diphosphokinase [Eggerthellaceae bacterium]|nr:thiamine diphosphokinase [Eggerthellaceae bacterium]